MSYEHVLVTPSPSNRRFHDPDEQNPDEPTCGATLWRGREWVRKTHPRQILTYDPCSNCWDDPDVEPLGRVGDEVAADGGTEERHDLFWRICEACGSEIEKGQRYYRLTQWEADTEHWDSVEPAPNQKAKTRRRGKLRIHRRCLDAVFQQVLDDDHDEVGDAEPVADGGQATSRPRTPNRPESVDRLDGVDDCYVIDWWVKEHPPSFDTGIERDKETDDRTLSLVLRDENNEILAESQLWDYTGVYTLVRGKTVPENRPDRDDPPEPPEVIEWVYRESPIDHHVTAVRCTECGEQKDIQFPGMAKSKARFEPWGQIWHRPECSLASEKDRGVWGERHLADVVSEHPPPHLMTIGALWNECEWLTEIEELPHGYVTDAVHTRFHRIKDTLESRLDPRYPECPECGAADWRLDVDGMAEECRNCHFWEVDEKIVEQHRRSQQRIWGWRGHGDRNRGGDR